MHHDRESSVFGWESGGGLEEAWWWVPAAMELLAAEVLEGPVILPFWRGPAMPGEFRGRLDMRRLLQQTC